MKGRRYILPLAAIAAGVFLLNGCLPVPGSFNTPYGVRPDKIIGKSPEAMLSIGSASRAFVLETLGKPAAVSNTGALVYVFPVNTDGVFYLLCGATEREYDNRWLVLDFDADEVLAGEKTYKTAERAGSAVGIEYLPDPYPFSEGVFGWIRRLANMKEKPFKPETFPMWSSDEGALYGPPPGTALKEAQRRAEERLRATSKPAE